MKTNPFDKATKALKATTVNTSLFLWLNTITHHQYNHGDSFVKTFRSLYKEGGFPRFYSAFLPTLVNSSSNRFVDYLSHELIPTNNLTYKVFVGGLIASCFKTLITPLEGYKVISQRYGNRAHKIIRLNIRKQGLKTMWRGSTDNGLSNYVEHVTWFHTYDTLDKRLSNMNVLLKSGFLGLTSSFTTDLMSNHLKIVKTMKQTTNLTYKQIIKDIIRKNGVKGLFVRGLGTKLLTNGFQSLVFSILLNI